MKSRTLFGRAQLALLALLGVAAPAAEAQQAAAAGSTPAPDTAKALPMDPAVTVGTLPNGLRYYVRANQRPEKRAELRLVVNAGSVLEDDDQRGLAHFVEHMAFNGTRNFEKQEIVNYLERIGMRFGADVNAHTGFDETVYELQVPTDSAQLVARAFDILEDWAHQVTFDTTEVRKERGVITEEWRRGRGAGARMSDKQLPVLLQGSRYARRLPIGDMRVIDTASAATLRRFYTDWYRPDLMAVVAVGDFDKKAIEGLIREHFSSIPARRNARPRTVFPVPGHDSTLVAIATDREATGSSVQVLYKQPVREERTVGAYRRGMVEGLYNGMLNDRLFELTRKPDAPFIGASSGGGRFVRSAEMYTLGARVKEGGIERGLEALLTEAERVDRHGFTATELERAKQDYLRGLEQAYAEREKTNSARYAEEYSAHFLNGDPAPGIAYEYELGRALIPGVSLGEINRLGRESISDRNRVILANAPEKPDVPVPSAAALLAVFERVDRADVAAYADSVSDAPLLEKLPTPGRVVAEKESSELGTREWRLSNGVRVILKPTDFKADEVLFTAYSPGGSSLAGDERYLSAALASQVVSLGGVGAFDAIELQKKLAGKAVRVGPYIGTEEEGIGGSASPRDLETMFQLVYLYFTAPRRDSSAFEAFRANAKAALANRGASPQAAFQDTLQVTLAQHHPRARPISSALLDEVELDEAMAFYRDRFADASDFTFVFVGTFTPDSLKPLVERYLGALPSTRRKETWKDNGIVPPKGVVEREVRKGIEPRSQTQIVFTGPFEYTAANRHAIRSLADVLNIKLREQLREELGGTYGASVGASPDRVPRPEYSFTIGFGSAPDRAEQLVAAVFAQIDSVKAVGASAGDLAKVKEMQIRGWETSLKQNGFWLGQLAAYDQMGEDPRAILDYRSAVGRLTAETVRDAARRYLNAQNYVRVTLYPEASGAGDGTAAKAAPPASPAPGKP
jgi:zinc protease